MGFLRRGRTTLTPHVVCDDIDRIGQFRLARWAAFLVILNRCGGITGAAIMCVLGVTACREHTERIFGS